MLVWQMKHWLEALGLIVIIQTVSGLTCKGGRNLIQGFTQSCITSTSNGNIEESLSCLIKEREESSLSCSSDSCFDVNMRIKDGFFNDTEYKFWSFSSCFKQTMAVRLCPEDIEEVKPTTEAHITSRTDDEEETTDSTDSPDDTTDDTTDGDDDGDVTTVESTTSLVDDGVPMDGCISGMVTFSSASCKKEILEVNLVSETDGRVAKVEVAVLGCCSTADCKADDGVSRSNTCNFGKNDDVVSVPCKGGCFTHLRFEDDGTSNSYHGCLPDLELFESAFSGITSCSSTYQEGTCISPAGVNEECLRCCTSSNCNNYNSKSALLAGTPSTPKGSSAALLPSAMLLLTAGLLGLRM